MNNTEKALEYFRQKRTDMLGDVCEAGIDTLREKLLTNCINWHTEAIKALELKLSIVKCEDCDLYTHGCCHISHRDIEPTDYCNRGRKNNG